MSWPITAANCGTAEPRKQGEDLNQSAKDKNRKKKKVVGLTPESVDDLWNESNWLDYMDKMQLERVLEWSTVQVNTSFDGNYSFDLLLEELLPVSFASNHPPNQS